MKRLIPIILGLALTLVGTTFQSCNTTQPDGQLLFWVNSDLGCGSITVTISGNNKTITSYYPSAQPDCNSSGCAVFTLQPGSYNVHAECTGYTWDFSKTVSSNTCTKTQLVP